MTHRAALFLAIMGVIGCRDGGPNQGREDMEPRVGTLREGSQPPTLEEVADCLLAALPERDRERARPLIVGELLPRALEGDASRDRDVAIVVLETLGGALSAVRPERRLHELRVLVHKEILMQLSRRSLHLALARYLKGRTAPLPREFAEDRAELLRDLQPLVALSATDIERRADELLRQLEGWRRETERVYPEISTQGTWTDTMAEVDCARSGDFTFAGGNLYRFLRKMGEEPFRWPSY